MSFHRMSREGRATHADEYGAGEQSEYFVRKGASSQDLALSLSFAQSRFSPARATASPRAGLRRAATPYSTSGKSTPLARGFDAHKEKRTQGTAQWESREVEAGLRERLEGAVREAEGILHELDLMMASVRGLSPLPAEPRLDPRTLSTEQLARRVRALTRLVEEREAAVARARYSSLIDKLRNEADTLKQREEDIRKDIDVSTVSFLVLTKAGCLTSIYSELTQS